MSVRGTHGADDEDGDTVLDRVSGRFGSNADRITYLLAQYRLPITLALIAVGGLLLSGSFGLPRLPEPVQLGLQGFAIGAVPAAVLGRIVIKKFFADPRKLVLVLDPRRGVFSDVWRVPPRLWDARDEGEFPPVDVSRGPVDHVVTRLAYVEEEDQLVVEGCNPEIANPVDLLATEGKLDVLFTDAQDAMAELSRIKGTWKVLATEHEAELITSLAEAYEHSVAWDPDAATDTFDNSMWNDDTDDDGAESEERTRSDRAPSLEEQADEIERRRKALLGEEDDG